MVAIQATPSGNPIAIADGIRQKMKDLEPNLPPGLHALVQFDSTLFIRASIQEVIKSLEIAVAVVVLSSTLVAIPQNVRTRRC